MEQYLEAWKQHEITLFDSDYTPIIQQKYSTFMSSCNKYIEQLELDSMEIGKRESRYHSDIQLITNQLSDVKLLLDKTMKEYNNEEESVLTHIKSQRTKVITVTKNMFHQQTLHQGLESKQRNIQLLNALREIQ